jgi:hypothetical protein
MQSPKFCSGSKLRQATRVWLGYMTWNVALFVRLIVDLRKNKSKKLVSIVLILVTKLLESVSTKVL